MLWSLKSSMYLAFLAHLCPDQPHVSTQQPPVTRGCYIRQGRLAFSASCLWPGAQVGDLSCVHGSLKHDAQGKEGRQRPQLGSPSSLASVPCPERALGPCLCLLCVSPWRSALWFADLSKLGTAYHSALGGKKPGSSQLGLLPLSPASLLLTPQLMGPSGVMYL